MTTANSIGNLTSAFNGENGVASKQPTTIKNMKMSRHFAILLALILGSVLASAQNFTNTASGYWSVSGKWTPATAPTAGGAAADIIVFNPTAADNSTNDLAGAFWLNQLQLVASQAVTLQSSNASSLLFTNNGAALPLITNAVANALTINSGITLATNLTAGVVSSGSITINSNISESVTGTTLTKTGAGTLTLNGLNSYSGQTIVPAGNLNFNSLGTVGGGASSLGAPTTVTNGTINISGGSTAIFYTGGATASDRIINAISGSPTIDSRSESGLLTLNGNIIGSGAIILKVGTNNCVVNGAISVSSGLYVTGGTIGGTAILSNPSNSFPVLSLNQGTLSVNTISNSSKVCAIGNGTSISFGQASTIGKLQFTGANGGACNRALAISAGTSYSGGGAIENTVAGQTLTMSGKVNTVAAATAPVLQLMGVGNGVMSGSISNVSGTALEIIKSGGGTWTLSGTNVYSGPTIVSGGVLLVNGDSSAVNNTWTVASGATLGGTGTIGGSVTLSSGGALAPGTPGGAGTIGTLTLPNTLTLNGGNTVFFTLNDSTTAGTTYDQVASTSGLSLNGDNYIQINTPAGTLTNGTYTLMTYTGLSGSGTLSLVPALAALGNLTLTVGETSVTLTVSADTSVGTTLIWKGYVNGTWDTATANWFNGIATSYADGNNVTLDDTAAIFGSTNGAVAPGSVTFNNSVSNYVVSTSIAGTGSVSKFGTRTATLMSSNSYSGGTVLNAGTLAVSNNYALGTGPLTVAASSGLATLTTLTLPNNVVLNDQLTNTVASGTTNTLAGNISNIISGGTNASLYCTGSGRLRLTGTNMIALTNPARTYVYNTLELAGGLTLFTNEYFRVYNGGNMLVSGGTHYIIGTNLAGQGIILNGNGSMFTMTGGAVYTSFFSMGFGTGNSPTANINGGYLNCAVAGGNGFTLGNGISTSDVATLNLNGGTLEVRNIQLGNLSGGTNILNLNGGTVKAAATVATFVTPASASSPGAVVNVLTNGVVFDTAGYNVGLTNALLNGGGGGGLTKLNTGTLTLSGANAYSGPTIVSNGVLLVNGDSSATTNTWTVRSGATLGGTGTIGGAVILSTGAFATNVVGLPLTVTKGLTLNGNTMNVTTLSALGDGDYLLITNTSATPISGSFPVVNVTGAGVTGTASIVTTANAVTLHVAAASSAPGNFSGISVSGTSLTLNVTNGSPNGAWTLLASTNLALPLSQWTTNLTGNYDGSGNLSTNLLNTATNPMEFFILK